MTYFIMAGIIPFSKVFNKKINNYTYYFLFARESLDNDSKHAGLYSDFGGRAESNETKYQAALREFYEESSGLLGSPSLVRSRMSKQKLVKFVNSTNYTSYLYEIRYDIMLPKYMKNHYNFIKKYKIELINEYNGLYEKDDFRWFELSELNDNLNIFRPFYKTIIKKVITYFSE